MIIIGTPIMACCPKNMGLWPMWMTLMANEWAQHRMHCWGGKWMGRAGNRWVKQEIDSWIKKLMAGTANYQSDRWITTAAYGW